MELIDYLTVFLSVAFVLGLLLVASKYLTYKTKSISKGKYMQIIESLSLGLNIRIHLIKVDNEFYIISATNKDVKFLSKVNIEDYKEKEVKNPVSDIVDFKAVLKKYSNAVIGGKSDKNEAKPIITQEKKSEGNSEMPEDDDILKKNLKKLKHLTNNISDQWSQNEQKKDN